MVNILLIAPLQSPWSSVTQGPFSARIFNTSLCSQMTLPPMSMLSIGSLTIQVTLCKEKDLRAFRSPVSTQFSLNSLVSTTRHCHFSSGGGWTSNPPISPQSIPIFPDPQSQEQGPCNSQVQETEAGREHSKYHPLPPLPICTSPVVYTLLFYYAKVSTQH